MPGLVSSCRSSNAAVAAFNMVPIANPASSMFSMAKWPLDFARLQTMAIASSEPPKASTSMAPNPANVSDGTRNTAMAPPSAAPPEAPRTNGSASGLRNRPWKSTPVADRPAPTNPAASTRGSRRVYRMMPASPAADGCSRARNTSPNDSFTAPIPAEMMITTSSSNAGITRVRQRLRTRPCCYCSFQLSPPSLNSIPERKRKGQRRIAKRFVVVLVEQVAHGCIRRSPAW